MKEYLGGDRSSVNVVTERGSWIISILKEWRRVTEEHQQVKKKQFSMMVKTQVIIGVLNDGLLQGRHHDSDHSIPPGCTPPRE